MTSHPSPPFSMTATGLAGVRTAAAAAAVPADPGPPPIAPPLGQDVARELPTWGDNLADGFPQFTDAVTGELSADAYKIIRRTAPVAYPVWKLGTILSRYRLTAVPARKGNAQDIARAAVVQTILDAMQNADIAIRDLTWGLVEGVIFGWLTGYPQDGLIIPRISIRRKVKAGGIIEWDGRRVAKQARWITGVADAKAIEDTKAAELPRHRLLVWQPGNDANPEGDTTLAWWLYLLAEEAQQQRKNRVRYGDRHGLPWEIIKKELEGVRGQKVQDALTAGANALKRLPHQGLAMSAKDMLQMLEPSGATWQFLTEYDKAIAKEAHQLVLLNALTSDTSDAGPTGSSKLHGDQQDMALAAVASSMGQAFTSDVLSFIEFYNQVVLAPVPGRCRIELQPEEQEREPEPTKPSDALAAAQAGVAFDSTWFYGLYGTKPPPGTPPVFKLAPQPSPFGGFGGLASGAPAAHATKGVADHEPIETPELTLPGALSRAAARPPADTLDAAIAVESSALARLIEASIPHIIAGGLLPPETGDMLSLAMGRLHLRGMRTLREEVAAHTRGSVGAKLTMAAGVAQRRLVTADQIKLRDLAARYREIAVPAAAVATESLRKRLINKLGEFIESGGFPGDHLGFRDWLLESQPALPESYADLVLRNGLGQAYQAGRNEEYRTGGMEELGLNRQILTAGDDAVRDEHKLYDGIVLPPGEEWDYLLPPFDHNCRCTLVVVDQEPSPIEELKALPRPGFADNRR